VEFDDRALVLDGTLVLADLHVGREAANVEVPVGERADLRDRLSALLSRHEPADVVVAGDLLDSFGGVPAGAAETVHELERVVADSGAELVVVRGNHDVQLPGVLGRRVRDAHRVGDTLVCHGHEPPPATAGRYVVGHDHPTIEIEGQRRPCYLVGEQAAGEVVMLPAFTRLVRGVRVNRMRAREFQSPLVTDPDTLRPVVPDEDAGDTLEFPPLGEFRSLL
jgi:putative SbcD/Mre11-related phosphoesterase